MCLACASLPTPIPLAAMRELDFSAVSTKCGAAPVCHQEKNSNHQPLHTSSAPTQCLENISQKARMNRAGDARTTLQSSLYALSHSASKFVQSCDATSQLKSLTSDCFARYVHTKTIKRLESFRVNFAAKPDEQRKILVPLSFGVSSVTLLHILDLHLNTQKSKTGRTGFAIKAVFVDCGDEKAKIDEKLSQIQEHYPDHEFASLPMYQVFRLLPKDDALHALVPLADVDHVPQSHDQLHSLITSLTSATARADVISTLRTRLIVEYAKQAGCESIMWGHSTTRLAEETLAETAKGRGFGLPWQLSDGQSPFGINFHYPMRDVLKKELISYVQLTSSNLASFVVQQSGATQASMSSKNTTIDDLMKQYFESVETNFPSIVSNVVRTAGKLEKPTSETPDPSCSLCGMPVPEGRFGIHGWGGNQHQDISGSSHGTSAQVCYGCTRSLPKSSSA